ncbi:MAG: formate--tetrahydrofolate ligase [Alphaproteobacteria bacterium]|nr:formate--tetrahydrofolate ligase [Alphaproteobacteria bacterium]MBO7537364.1 formate--tetrahydrofolate ligase [Alphaproteobacteria bacterium]
MKTDIEISQSANKKNILEIAKKLGLGENDLELYGSYKAKIAPSAREKLRNKKDGKLILVTSINPTPAGEGKTTVSIGLGEALSLLNYKTCIALREPSLGPCFGLKGCATGGGYSQIIPMEDINLHFTGDFHAITSAHNLLAAMIDNHIYYGNKLDFDLKRITWKRVLDVNDRALRNIIIGLGNKTDGVVRETGFDITAASEIMAILCLSEDLEDLRRRIDNIIIGYNSKKEEITCKMLGATGALVTLLKDAIKPNLVQTIGGTPAFVHGGPFANIAHGCSSLIATKCSLKLADYTVTEAGFGADLGAEKFLDIKCPLLGKYPDVVVIVATVKAIKMHGYVTLDRLQEENLAALEAGFENLEKHIQNVKRYNLPVVIALNVFSSDTQAELNFIRERCDNLGVKTALCKVWELGGKGGLELAEIVAKLANKTKPPFHHLYNATDSTSSKIEKIASVIYGASGVNYMPKARQVLDQLTGKVYPVCLAKTQSSLSDDKSLLGRPKNFKITINDIRIMAGAGFVVAYAGNIMTMMGLPVVPRAEKINSDSNSRVVGLD